MREMEGNEREVKKSGIRRKELKNKIKRREEGDKSLKHGL